jgi:hypothetical protein
MSSQLTNAEGQTSAADCARFLQLIKPLAQEYEANREKQEKFDTGFNLFELISDHYYRETFHSDILKALLDPHGKHQGGKKYLDLFLQFINSRRAAINLQDYSNAQVEREEGRIDILIKGLNNSRRAAINLQDYSNAQVEREEGRIDILIKGLKHAIIIENKIYDAKDPPEQLPRYLKKVTDNDYDCDAIIYLRLNGDTPPDNMAEWPDDKWKQQVKDLLIVICAYDHSENNLLKGWIEPCEKESEKSKNADAQHILRQYGKIIEKLGGNIMNKPIMKEFYETVVKDETNFKTFLSLKKMWDELINYRAQMIIDKFQTDFAPFEKPFRSRSGDVGVLFKAGSGNTGLCMVVWVRTDSYLFVFNNDPGGEEGNAGAILKGMGIRDEFTFEKKWGVFQKTKTFAFPSEEDQLYKYISAFKKKLGEQLSRCPARVEPHR